jgi:glycosyltransferase involved in cell wall biosynthesis
LRLDIVIPAHNEEHRIDRMLAAYRTGIEQDGARFVVALDQCSDRTADIVRRHMVADHRVGLVEYPKLGKGGVIAETLRRSDADVVGFVDADGATPPGELLRLVDTVDAGADAAIACRRHPAAVVPARRTLGRRLASRGFAASTRLLLRLPHADTQCGAKVLRRHAAARALARVRTTGLSFDVDLLLAARDLGHRVVDVPTVWIDQEGSRVRPVRDTRRMGGSLVGLWARRRLGAARARLRRRGAARVAVPFEVRHAPA